MHEIEPRPDLFDERPRLVWPGEEVAAFLAPFRDEDKELIGYRNGLDRGGMLRSLEEVGEHFGMTRDEVRTAEARAMANRETNPIPETTVRLRRALMGIVEPDSTDG